MVFQPGERFVATDTCVAPQVSHRETHVDQQDWDSCLDEVRLETEEKCLEVVLRLTVVYFPSWQSDGKVSL